MIHARYRLSFTTGGLLVREAGVAARLYQSSRDWEKVRAVINTENGLQARTVASAHRLAREVIQRLGELTEEEIDVLVDATAAERGHLLWVAACRRYDLIGEFAEEVLRERFLLMNPTLGPEIFDSFVQAKSLWHQELDGLAASTRQRLRSNLFLMLKEAGMMTEGRHIAQSVLSDRVSTLLTTRTPSDIRFFPAYDAAKAHPR